MKEYTVSVISAALLTGIICGLTEKGFAAELIRLICTFVIVATMMRPLLATELSEITGNIDLYREDAVYHTELGSRMASNAMDSIIKEQAEAYILKQAEQFQTKLAAEIFLENSVPVQVVLRGAVSPYAKTRLSEILETELGIARENQLWT